MQRLDHVPMMFSYGTAIALTTMTVGYDQGFDPRSTADYGGNRAPTELPALPSVRDFMESARDITPRALAVPPTHLPIAGEFRFVIEIASDVNTGRTSRACAWLVRARGAPREKRPIRSRPGFRQALVE